MGEKGFEEECVFQEYGEIKEGRILRRHTSYMVRCLLIPDKNWLKPGETECNPDICPFYWMMRWIKAQVGVE